MGYLSPSGKVFLDALEPYIRGPIGRCMKLPRPSSTPIIFSYPSGSFFVENKPVSTPAQTLKRVKPLFILPETNINSDEFSS
jgi:hypothetical protein